jgi:uncharacterized protein (DUF305 family)
MRSPLIERFLTNPGKMFAANQLNRTPMKKFVLLFAIPAMVACNDPKDNPNDNTGSNGHMHGDTTKNHINQLHASMTRMMTDMRNAQPSGDPDKDFAVMMKIHHQAAVNMAQVQLAGGSDSSMLALARSIIADQETEIRAFDEFIAANRGLKGKSRMGQRFLDLMSDHDMKNATSTVDGSFVSMMIPHHEDGIKMAKEYLTEAKNEKLKQIAENIIRSQEKEIRLMQNWLATWQEPSSQPGH